MAESGKRVTNFFCPDCGSTLWRESPTFGENKVIKSGVLDTKDALQAGKPSVELYAAERLDWVEKRADTDDVPGMPS